MPDPIKIEDRLYAIAQARAKRSPDGIGFARTKNHSVRWNEYGVFGWPSVESVRFIDSPMLTNSDGIQEHSEVES